jgi:hypothetical protein
MKDDGLVMNIRRRGGYNLRFALERTRLKRNLLNTFSSFLYRYCSCGSRAYHTSEDFKVLD